MLQSCKVLFKCYLFLSVRTQFCFHLHWVCICVNLCISWELLTVSDPVPNACGAGRCLSLNSCIFSKVLWLCRRAAAPGVGIYRCLGWGRRFPLAPKKGSSFWCLFLLIYFSARCRKCVDTCCDSSVCRYTLWFISCMCYLSFVPLKL